LVLSYDYCIFRQLRFVYFLARKKRGGFWSFWAIWLAWATDQDDDDGELVELFVEDPAGDPDYVDSSEVDHYYGAKDEHPEADQNGDLVNNFYFGADDETNGLEHDTGATTCYEEDEIEDYDVEEWEDQPSSFETEEDEDLRFRL
jgi:hypothetical protein